MDALQNRGDLEKKLTQFESQRFCTDRPAKATFPWSGASNYRHPLAATIIDKKKPYKYKVLMSGDQLANFKSLKKEFVEFSSGCAFYFDFHLKELTNWEREVQYVLDSGEQEGFSPIKIMYDRKKEHLTYQWIDNLFLIVPNRTTDLDEAPWLIHVLQLSPGAVKRRFKDVEGIDEFVQRINETCDTLQNDTYDKQENRYKREGIRLGEKDSYIVLWEVHYMDEEGNRRLRTICPHDFRFDFGDDRAYPYYDAQEVEDWGWMIKHYRRKITNKDIYSSQGVCEEVREFEFILSKAMQARQNWMSLSTSPTFSAPGGTGSTQNMTWRPGVIYPFELKMQQYPAPPAELMEEMQYIQGVAEQRAATPDFGIGRNNTQDESRTKYEVQQIANVQGLSADLETGNWKSFLREVYRYSWRLLTQFKPKSLSYYMDNELAELDPMALEDSYQITCSGSAESVDKEFVLGKAIALLDLAMKYQLPCANIEELWKNILEISKPGEVQRFFVPISTIQAKDQKKAASDINIIVGLGFPLQAQPGDNHAVSAQTGLQYLDAVAQRGEALTPQQVNLVSMYIQSHREALKKTNKQAYEQLNEALNVVDMQQAGGQQAGQQPPMPGVNPIQQQPQAA